MPASFAVVQGDTSRSSIKSRITVGNSEAGDGIFLQACSGAAGCEGSVAEAAERASAPRRTSRVLALAAEVVRAQQAPRQCACARSRRCHPPREVRAAAAPEYAQRGSVPPQPFVQLFPQEPFSSEAE